MTDADIQTQKK